MDTIIPRDGHPYDLIQITAEERELLLEAMNLLQDLAPTSVQNLDRMMEVSGHLRHIAGRLPVGSSEGLEDASR